MCYWRYYRHSECRHLRQDTYSHMTRETIGVMRAARATTWIREARGPRLQDLWSAKSTTSHENTYQAFNNLRSYWTKEPAFGVETHEKLWEAYAESMRKWNDARETGQPVIFCNLLLKLLLLEYVAYKDFPVNGFWYRWIECPYKDQAAMLLDFVKAKNNHMAADKLQREAMKDGSQAEYGFPEVDKSSSDDFASSDGASLGDDDSLGDNDSMGDNDFMGDVALAE
ncbi:hypothetical protein PG988_002141 [Apiospora saccharicola]